MFRTKTSIALLVAVSGLVALAIPVAFFSFKLTPLDAEQYRRYAVELADKCLWGTDYPSPGIASMSRNVEDFTSLPISEDAKRKILWDNAAALFG